MVGVAACRPEFQLKNFTTNDVLYKASLAEYQRHHWDNAIQGFEKLTTDLPARDTLLPRSYWYLASSHQHQDELLLAAQSFERLVESFPEDSLADDAGLDAARSYRRLWRKPGLDSKYGEQALASYNTLIGLYPTSPLVAVAQKDIAELENWFAKKDYDAGMYYFRRKAYDSGILYFKDVLAKFANAPMARDAAHETGRGVQGDPLQGRCVRAVRADDGAVLDRPRGREHLLRYSQARPDQGRLRSACVRQASRLLKRCGSGSSGGASIPPTLDIYSSPATH